VILADRVARDEILCKRWINGSFLCRLAGVEREGNTHNVFARWAPVYTSFTIHKIEFLHLSNIIVILIIIKFVPSAIAPALFLPFLSSQQASIQTLHRIHFPRPIPRTPIPI
jgi:hypothetical protein